MPLLRAGLHREFPVAAAPAARAGAFAAAALTAARPPGMWPICDRLEADVQERIEVLLKSWPAERTVGISLSTPTDQPYLLMVAISIDHIIRDHLDLDLTDSALAAINAPAYG